MLAINVYLNHDHDIDCDLDCDLDHGNIRHDKERQDKVMSWYRSRSRLGNARKGKARKVKESQGKT
jgi:hypothetical protein